ncbi:MAG: hypothetical protein ACI8S6_002249 [Myxococcota bacterium]|jgi:hypothetical protein
MPALWLLTIIIAYAEPDRSATEPYGRTPPELCSTQRLHNPVALTEQPAFYTINNAPAAYGTPELVGIIEYASAEMAWLRPGADPILIGDLSRPHGGQLPPHKSHRSGLDADIGIYRRGGDQPETNPFVVTTADTIDHRANWLFWSALLETGLVDRILLDQSLIDAMRVWTVAEGELSESEALAIFPPRGTPRIWSMTGVFQHMPRHRDHIHLRARCGVPDEPLSRLGSRSGR